MMGIFGQRRSRRDGSLKSLWRDEHGMTSAGMAVSLLVCLALVFSSAQVFKVSSASSEVQEVADAAALAAENEVAEFMIAVNVCDAAVLSMTLLGATVIGAGIVTACIPPLFSVSESLMSFGSKIVEARDRFSEAACQGLDTLQRALPFLAAVSAQSIAAANDKGALDSTYVALGVLVPSTGKPIGAPVNDGLAELNDEAQANVGDIRDAAQRAEEAAAKAQKAKEDAFMADCGNAPERCQYERADHLSAIRDYENPLYESVDAWSFGVAQDRAITYYRTRMKETEPAGTVADKASFHLRKRFYEYAYGELCSARDRAGGLEEPRYFPKLFRTTKEFRGTKLYSESVYAITSSPDVNKGIMHAYPGCPSVHAIIGYGSIQQLDEGVYEGCATCAFDVESMGNVASATTNVSSGFEHHYEKIRVAAEEYREAKAELDALKDEVEAEADPLMALLEQLLSGVGGQRIKADPPGSAGCIVLARSTASVAADSGFESSFVSTSATVGGSAAVSAATLIEDSSHDGSSVITSLLDGFGQDGGATVGAARIALDMWSGLLRAYEDGQAALTGAVEGGLSSIPNDTLSGLGQWMSSKLTDVVSAAGLEPANLKAEKAVLINSGYIAGADTGGFSATFSKVKGSVLAISNPSPDILTGIAESVSRETIEAIDDATFTIAEIEFPVGDIVIPITITLPQSLREGAENVVESAIDAFGEAVSSITGARSWQ